jgi:hypothetical protein
MWTTWMPLGMQFTTVSSESQWVIGTPHSAFPWNGLRPSRRPNIQNPTLVQDGCQIKITRTGAVMVCERSMKCGVTYIVLLNVGRLHFSMVC